MDEKKRQVWRFVIQTAISILTAIATALGVTSCMAAVLPTIRTVLSNYR